MKNISERSIEDIILSDLRNPATRTVQEIVGRDFSDDSYISQGVHFNGTTWITINSLVSSDNETASFSFWFLPDAVSSFPTYWVSDPDNNIGNLVNYGTGETDITAYFGNGTDTINGAGPPYAAVSMSVWNHLIGSVDSATGKLALYLTGVSVGQPPRIVGSSGTILFNGLVLKVGNDAFGDALVGSMADLWIAPGVSLLDGSGGMPVATRRNFITADGKPINPSVYMGLYGGAVMLSATVGDAASFATNQGTGGAFVTTGALTLAATSP
jgi:hypothetical protein